jgi:hypothetical protein
VLPFFKQIFMDSYYQKQVHTSPPATNDLRGGGVTTYNTDTLTNPIMPQMTFAAEGLRQYREYILEQVAQPQMTFAAEGLRQLFILPLFYIATS